MVPEGTESPRGTELHRSLPVVDLLNWTDLWDPREAEAAMFGLPDQRATTAPHEYYVFNKLLYFLVTYAYVQSCGLWSEYSHSVHTDMSVVIYVILSFADFPLP